MYGQNNYYYPQPQPQQLRNMEYMQYHQPPSCMIKGRPVASIDEVKAAQIDFDGSLFIFPDIANKRIYTKQINLDGTASLNIYELEVKNDTSNTSNYVTKDEFNKTIAEMKEMLSQKVESKGGKVNESINF